MSSVVGVRRGWRKQSGGSRVPLTVQYSTVQCQIERECVSINKILIVSDIRSLERAGLREKQRKITFEVRVMVRVMARVGLELI